MKELKPLNIAVLTVSDSRTLATDQSGNILVERLQKAGHQLGDRLLVPDNIYQIRAAVSQWIANTDLQAILVTGGTGFTARDTTPDALTPLFDQVIEGYGELFRQLSYTDIGTSTVHVPSCRWDSLPHRSVCHARFHWSLPNCLGWYHPATIRQSPSTLQLCSHGDLSSELRMKHISDSPMKPVSEALAYMLKHAKGDLATETINLMQAHNRIFSTGADSSDGCASG